MHPELKNRLNDGLPTPQRITYIHDGYRTKLKSKQPSMRAIHNYNNISTDDNDDEGVDTGGADTIREADYDNLTFLSDLAEISENGIIRDNPLAPPVYSRSSDLSLITTLQRKRANQHQPEYSATVQPPDQQAKIYITSSSVDETYDYPTLGSRSSRGTTVHTRSSEDYGIGTTTGSDRTEEFSGSTAKLVPPKIRERWQTCINYIELSVCTCSLAAGFGNLYRLPQSVLSGGGLPFLVAYIILALLLGIPLMALELGLGQIVQDTFTRTWRAVPFFRGVGHIKIIAGYLLAIYYPVQIALSVLYIIWSTKSSVPFPECAVVRMKENGYRADGINGTQCLSKTFLESPFEDPTWFGIFAGSILGVWIVVLAWSLKKTKTYEKALIYLFILTLGCLIALLVKAGPEFSGLKTILDSDVEWSVLSNSYIWYYAAVQVFFSTNIGFGVFVTNANVIYKKVNPFWTSLWYMLINLTFGIVATLVIYSLLQYKHVDTTLSDSSVAEVHLMTLIYDIALQSDDSDMIPWAVVAYFMIFFAGLISMITIVNNTFKAIANEADLNLRWWQFNTILTAVTFLFGAACLLYERLEIVHLLDYYITGNLVLISIVFEVLTFIIFYGWKRIQSDLEFVIGSRLSRFWLTLWWINPLLLIGILIWHLATGQLTESTLTNIYGRSQSDSLWVYVTGWGVVASSLVLILAFGLYNVIQQGNLTFIEKFRSSFKQTSNWGPKDPIMRLNWFQWHSKAASGTRDFTLKRRGTKEYTHSVKNRAKYARRNNTEKTKSYSPGNFGGPHQGDAVLSRGSFRQHRQDEFGDLGETPYYMSNLNQVAQSRPISVPGEFGGVNNQGRGELRRFTVDGGVSGKTNINPLLFLNSNNAGNPVNGNIIAVASGGYSAHNGNAANQPTDGSTNSEGYGTYNNRRGPYVIGTQDHVDVGHVCYRKQDSCEEDATEL